MYINSLSGNHAKKFLLYGKDDVSVLIEDAGKAKVVSEIIEHLHVVIRVINSGRKVGNILVYFININMYYFI